MSKFKKTFGLFTAITLFVSTIPTFSSAYTASDVSNTEYKTAATVLGALEIMVGDADTGLFRPSDPIKRSEIAKVAVALKGLSNISSSLNNNSYPDVNTDHWASEYISTATSEGLVIGDDTGNFRPDDDVTYAETLTILVRALGYETRAIAKGGYPVGYISTASSTGLSKNVSVYSDKAVTRGDVAKLAYNALTINIMEQTEYGSSSEYKITDKTLLKDFLNTDLIQGTVTAVGNASIDDEKTEKGNIVIDGKTFKTGNADVRNILGFYADAYVTNSKSPKGKGILLAVVPSEGENSSVEISADSIKSISENSGYKTIEYYTNENGNKTSSIKVGKNAKIIYNGMPGTMSDFSVISSGSVVLLDSQKNKNYDIVLINETVNFVVDEVYEKSGKITDKYNQPAITLDAEDDTLSYVLDKNNKSIDINELEPWDVITLTVSKDKKLIYGYVSSNSVEGRVTAKSNEYVHINDEKYKIASNYTEQINLGDSGIFYIDVFGKIAAFDGEGNRSSNYAYLTNAAVSDGLGEKLMLQVLDKNSEIVTLNAAKKIIVNDSSPLSPSKALNALNGTNQLITYQTNDDNEVTKIYTAQTSDEPNESVFTLNLAQKDVVYKASTSTLSADKINIKTDTNTLVFDIPSSASSIKDFTVRDKTFFTDGGKYDISVYDVNEDLTAGVIIVTNSDAKISDESPVAIVEKISKSKNSNGDIVQRLDAFSDGKQITMYTSGENILVKSDGKELEAGDTIQLKTNKSGEIDSINVLFDISKSDTEFSKTHSSNLVTEYGKITKTFADSFNFNVNNGSIKNYSLSSADIYIVQNERNGKAVSVGNKSDIQKYDDSQPEKVLLIIYKDEIREIIVIR